MNKIKLPLRHLIDKPIGAQEVYQINQKILSPDPLRFQLKKPLIGQIKLIKLNTSLLGDFKLETEFSALCDRCNKEIIKKVDLGYQQEFQEPPINNFSENSNVLYSLTNDNIDILPSINQELILKIPIKLLCIKKCRGLCTNCGTNLNHKKCICT